MTVSLFSRLMAADTDSRIEDERLWNAGVAMLSASGVRVTDETAMTAGAIWACVRVVSEDIAMLPLILYRHLDGGGKERARDLRLYRRLHDQPNQTQTTSEWIEMMQHHLELRGNAYNQIIGNARGEVEELIPLHPDRMTIDELPDRSLRYTYRPPIWLDDTGDPWVFGQDEILHLRGFGSDGIRGLSTISYARETIGENLATREYANRFFSQGGTPPAVLTHPKELKEPAARRIRREWHEQHAGLQNAHRVAVLEEGMGITELGFSMADAQLIQQRTFGLREAARVFRVTPHMLQDLERTTFNNVEHLALGHVQYTLGPRLKRWERRLNASLLPEDSELFFEFLVEGLLRGDLMTRYQAYAIGRRWGWLNVNDIREKENMNPVDGGDQYIVPGNYQELGSLEQPEPANNQNGNGNNNGSGAELPEIVISGNGRRHD